MEDRSSPATLGHRSKSEETRSRAGSSAFATSTRSRHARRHQRPEGVLMAFAREEPVRPTHPTGATGFPRRTSTATWPSHWSLTSRRFSDQCVDRSSLSFAVRLARKRPINAHRLIIKQVHRGQPRDETLAGWVSSVASVRYQIRAAETSLILTSQRHSTSPAITSLLLDGQLTRRAVVGIPARQRQRQHRQCVSASAASTEPLHQV